MSWAETSVIARRAAARSGDPRLVVAAVLLVTYLAPLNATMIVVAVPHVMAELDAPLAAGSLLVTSYLLVMAALPPLGGRLGDRWGRRSALLVGLGLFGLAALGASTAPGLYQLIAWRVLQAAGGAVAFPNALALLRERVSAQHRGLSFGLVGAVIALSAAIGPPLGQVLIAHAGWRAVFWINLPLTALTIGVGALTLPAFAVPASSRRRDLPDRRLPAALVVLGNRRFAAAALTIALSNVAMYATLVGLPLVLAPSVAASAGGFLLVALMGTAALVAPAAGRLADVRGRCGTAVAGLFIFAAGLLPIAIVGRSLGLLAMAGGLALAGIGLGASSTAIQTWGLEAVEAHQSGTGAGFLATSRYVGGAAGSTLVPVVMSAVPQEAMSALFAVAAAAAMLGALTLSQPRLAREAVPRLRGEPEADISRPGR
jgi:MFS family permease